MPPIKHPDTVWLFIFFDLPVHTQAQRSKTQRFRQRLLHNGFVMMQYSIYVRHCYYHAHANVYERRVTKYIPKDGHVTILRVRDKQFGKMRHFWGSIEKKGKLQPDTHQLTRLQHFSQILK